MKLTPTLLWLIAGLLLFLLCAFVLGPEWQYRREVSKYKLGMTAASIELKFGKPLRLHRSGNYLPEPATEDMKRRHTAYYIHTSCAEVDFNDYYEVIHVFKRTPLLRLMWEINPDWAAD